MYNLSVAEAHTYFVGAGQWLVHNGCDISITGDAKSKYGSYTITFKSGKRYHGKGPLSRAKQSTRYRSQQHNDEALRIQWTSSSSERQQRIDEAVRILSDDPNNTYNVINPPGLRHLFEDDIF